MSGFMKTLVAAAILTTFVAGDVAWGQSYEVPTNRRASEILSPAMVKGPYHEVDETVVTYGFLYHYSVKSTYGSFEVTGDAALRKLLREIGAIHALKQISTADAIGKSVVHAAKAPFEMAGKLIKNPVDTISAIPSGVFQVFENIGKGISEERDPSEDARIKQILFVSSWKRDFADKVGVDVYSSNKVLQKELNRVGWAAALTGLAVGMVSGQADAVVVTVGRTMRFSNQIGNAIKEEPPARLRLINEEKLAAMKVPEAVSAAFLDHPSFTPRHDTIIVEALRQMPSARGRGGFLQAAMIAADEASANFYQQMAETLRAYGEKVSPITEIRNASGFILATAKNGRVVVPFALDHGIWSRRGDRATRFMIDQSRSYGWKGGIDLLVTGTLSAMAKQQLTSRGFTVQENVDETLGLID